ncbi:unnamed protein product [Lactuca virosa]|uniref:DUF7733 domain-containing protein n=1 Tax=Lactuca virosa TaxID=75947 RepID=A0AAU9LZV9_9ASTR|nr:unnamed protein product [Lactuca virosa]
MSGVSLAVAPRSDPDETFTTTTADQKTQHHRQQEQTVVGGIMGSLRVIELQLVAFIMVFSASGLVPLFDLAFPVFTTIYLLLLSRLAFPGSTTTTSKEIFQGNRVFRAYVIFGTTVGLFLPLAYVLGGFARGDEHAVQSATPHLFLLSCQILTENIISGLSLFSPPDVAWFWFGRGLAVANLGYFSINMFVFLIPRFLPKAFDQYFRERNEIQRKMGEDKQFAGVRRDKKSD